MGLLSTLISPFVGDDRVSILLIVSYFVGFLGLLILGNILKQLLVKNPNEPPIVFHVVPFIGSTIEYGIDPVKFFDKCKAKYGDVFTFILLGKKTTVYVGTRGNDFILNGKLSHVNAEEIYSPLTTPVFGKDVVYDCPNSKLMEQKKFVKFGLTTEALRSYVTLIAAEVEDYVKRSPAFKGARGEFDVVNALAEITIFTASRTLQGKEVRDKFDATFADLYHDLDMGFSPINFMLPWAPLPHNRRRDIAHKKMVEVYMEIIQKRRAGGGKKDSEDMIWNLLNCKYKDGNQIPDMEIAHMMIALLMAGQHSSSSTSSWILLRMASRPEIMEELYREQIEVLGPKAELKFEDLARLPLHNQVVKETLRMHSPIHSIMRAVKQPMRVEGTPYTIPTSHVLLAAPIASGLSSHYFPSPEKWEPHRWDDGSGGTVNMQTSVEDEEKIDYGYGLVTKGASSPYLPFGAGRHRCIGEQFAYVQLTTILATLVKEFKFSELPGKGVPATDYTSLFSRPLCPAHLGWERRDKVAMD
ncbi:14 alpha-demethylase [Tothia fuscella]|uniref:14 alpha-demethylase n=1 Tax=Tothia fuscella TaxID=1048955 RepID=A0A9P4TUQ7_9PEZI|nr:14 alpha-demethylase [Tothia fuscella]